MKKDCVGEHGQIPYRRDANICEYLFVFQVLISLNNLNGFFLLAMCWYYSWGCLYVGIHVKQLFPHPSVTTDKACIHKTIIFFAICHSLILPCQVLKLDVAQIEIPPCYKTGKPTTHCFWHVLPVGLRAPAGSKVSPSNISESAQPGGAEPTWGLPLLADKKWSMWVKNPPVASPPVDKIFQNSSSFTASLQLC